jgi:HD superfamily phosphodiesterase
MVETISGIKIPDSQIAREAAELVRQHEDEMLFNHSVRVYVFGAIKGIRDNLKFDSELLYVAALFHDLGLADAYHTETKRFEVDGADAAREQREQVITAFPRHDFKNEFIQIQTRSALRKPKTTFGTINVDYIEYCDPTFRRPNVCTGIHGSPWHS